MIRDRAKHHETLNSHVSVLQCAQDGFRQGQFLGIIPPFVRGLKAPKFKRPSVYDLIVLVVELPLVFGVRVAIVVDRLESVVERINPRLPVPLENKRIGEPAAEIDYADR